VCYALVNTVAPVCDRRLRRSYLPVAGRVRRYNAMDWKNRLYFCDNLKILREYVATSGVDLIYLDPPFNSSATYNVLFKEKSGEESAAQITAFETVAPLYERRPSEIRPTAGHRPALQLGREAEAVYREIVERGPRKLADLVRALLAFLGRNDMMAYLVMMAIPLDEKGALWPRS
jgi:hypothetical protein